MEVNKLINYLSFRKTSLILNNEIAKTIYKKMFLHEFKKILFRTKELHIRLRKLTNIIST